MKKALVTIAIGEKYERLEKAYAKTRVAYADRHGYEYIVYTEMPPEWVEVKKKFPVGRQANMFKLYLPTLQQDYGFVAFIDSDTAVNPDAPCLTEYEPKIPTGGFAACETFDWEERHHYWPRMAADYYKGLEDRYGVQLEGIVNRKQNINGGLMLYRPQEIAERWRALSELDTPLTQENLLNVHDLQQGLVYFMPREWNLLWMYEKFRIGFLKPDTNDIVKVRNKLLNLYGKVFEKPLLEQAFRRCHMLHLAFEHEKLLWLDALKD